MAIYKNKVEWRGPSGLHLDAERRGDGVFSAPGPLWQGGGAHPEDAFVASANTCYFMMVVWACERFKMDLVSLEMEAHGEVEEFLDRTSWFNGCPFIRRLWSGVNPKKWCSGLWTWP